MRCRGNLKWKDGVGRENLEIKPELRNPTLSTSLRAGFLAGTLSEARGNF